MPLIHCNKKRQAKCRFTYLKKHESATRQVQGSANYVDDVIEPQGTLYAAVGVSQCAKGTINSINLDAVRQSEGVVDVVTIDDVPGHKDIGPCVRRRSVTC